MIRSDITFQEITLAALLRLGCWGNFGGSTEVSEVDCVIIQVRYLETWTRVIVVENGGNSQILDIF